MIATETSPRLALKALVASAGFTNVDGFGSNEPKNKGHTSPPLKIVNRAYDVEHGPIPIFGNIEPPRAAADGMMKTILMTAQWIRITFAEADCFTNHRLFH